MKIEEVRIDEISYHEKNPKQHPDKQIRLLEESIKRFGWTNPVILSADNTILAGHARVKAAIAAGNDTVPCIRTKLTGAEADAYLLADNRLSDIAPYDRDILAELLSDLPKDLVDLTGFDTVQVDALLAGEDIPDIDRFISDSQPEEGREEVDAEPQIDRAAELNKKWQVQPGDLWQCGDHRVICGDCTDPAVVERVMGGEKADLVLTDPPYDGCTSGAGFSKSPDIKARINKVMKEISHLYTFDPDAILQVCEKFLKSPSAWFFFCNKSLIPKYISYAIDTNRGFDVLLWHKPNFLPMAGCHYFPDTEYIIKIRDKSATFNSGISKDVVNYGSYYIIPSLKGASKDADHPTVKPVKIFTDQVLICSNASERVLDPFLGSGTTLIACENTGRKCRGIEISPDYCAVVLERFKEATGKEPERINE